MTLIVLALQLGLRRGELVRMDVDDVDWTQRTVLIHGKALRERRRPLPEEAHDMLVRLLREDRVSGGAVFRSRSSGQRLTERGLSMVARRIFERSGIKHRPFDGKSLHACRHTMISNILEQHGPWAAKEAAGQESWSAFSHYARGLVSDEMRTAMEGRRYAS